MKTATQIEIEAMHAAYCSASGMPLAFDRAENAMVRGLPARDSSGRYHSPDPLDDLEKKNDPGPLPRLPELRQILTSSKRTSPNPGEAAIEASREGDTNRPRRGSAGERPPRCTGAAGRSPGGRRPSNRLFPDTTLCEDFEELKRRIQKGDL